MPLTTLVELPPSFFELSQVEIRILLDSHKSAVHALENKPLLTQKLRDREKLMKEKKYPKTMIRVRFPDQYILEATFFSGARGTG